MNTLGSLISASFTVANDDWRARFFKAATPPSGVIPEEHARSDGRHRSRAVGQRRRNCSRCSTKPIRSRTMVHGARRPSCHILPTRRQTSHSRFVLPAVGCAPMASSCLMRMATSGAVRTGCPARSPASPSTSVAALVKALPNGTALSPAVTGFTGMGLDGVGWGTGVSLDKVWVGGPERDDSGDRFQRQARRQGKRFPDGRPSSAA